MPREELYPPIDPFETGWLALDGRHVMYWEQSGNPHGVPVVFLHGGPGAGATAVHRRFFDPRHYRIIVFDQRGAGRSLPGGEVIDNSTDHLIADMERLRGHFGIDRWILFGGSWGSTLAIAYGEAHPDRCLALVLRGIFLCRKQEIDWFLYGLRHVFPEPWRRLVETIPEGERGDLLGAFHRRLNDPDERVHLPAARAWSTYEGACSTLYPSPETIAAFGESRMAYNISRIETHFFVHDRLMHDNWLLRDVGRLRKLRGVIVQGRYDMVCPIVTADELARAWPEAEYIIVPDAGHSALDTGIRAALVRSMERLKNEFATVA